MLNYTTTTFVNSGNFAYCDGTHLYNAKGEQIENTAVNASDPRTRVSQKFIRVDFGPKIVNDGIIHKACLVGKKSYVAPVKAKLDFNLSTTGVATTNTIYRLVLYVRERNNNSPIFSNTWVFGGKPIIIEYTGGTNAAATLTSLMNTIKNYMLNIYGNEVFTVSNPSGNILRLEAKDQWTMFMTQEGKVEAYVEKLVDATSTVPEHWEIVTTITTTAASSNVIANGNEGFGDFAHIMKDLRLPTRENTNWFGTTVAAGENDDVPEPSGHYTQYTIQLTSERGVLQQSAVGGVGVSRTVHVFYVKEGVTLVEDDPDTSNTDETLTLINAFEAALAGAGIADSTRVTAVTVPNGTAISAVADDSIIADTRNTAATATV